MPFSAARRPSIASAQFNSENPETWGFAPPERRVWALALHDGRLYYSVGNGSAQDAVQVWSVSLGQDGSFGTDGRWELDVAGENASLAVPDMAFSQKGAMLLAQRAPVAGSYDYAALTQPAEAGDHEDFAEVEPAGKLASGKSDACDHHGDECELDLGGGFHGREARGHIWFAVCRDVERGCAAMRRLSEGDAPSSPDLG